MSYIPSTISSRCQSGVVSLFELAEEVEDLANELVLAVAELKRRIPVGVHFPAVPEEESSAESEEDAAM